MSPLTTACCVTVLNQQQQSNIHHYNQKANQLANDAKASPHSTKPKYCTVVEGGRVVVKPIAPNPE